MSRWQWEYVFAGLFAVLAVLTAIVPTWIEAVFRVEPDAGSGALEWGIVAVFGVLAVATALLGRRGQRAQLQTGAGG